MTRYFKKYDELKKEEKLEMYCDLYNHILT